LLFLGLFSRAPFAATGTLYQGSFAATGALLQHLPVRRRGCRRRSGPAQPILVYLYRRATRRGRRRGRRGRFAALAIAEPGIHRQLIQLAKNQREALPACSEPRLDVGLRLARPRLASRHDSLAPIERRPPCSPLCRRRKLLHASGAIRGQPIWFAHRLHARTPRRCRAFRACGAIEVAAGRPSACAAALPLDAYVRRRRDAR